MVLQHASRTHLWSLCRGPPSQVDAYDDKLSYHHFITRINRLNHFCRVFGYLTFSKSQATNCRSFCNPQHNLTFYGVDVQDGVECHTDGPRYTHKRFKVDASRRLDSFIDASRFQAISASWTVNCTMSVPYLIHIFVVDSCQFLRTKTVRTPTPWHRQADVVSE